MKGRPLAENQRSIPCGSLVFKQQALAINNSMPRPHTALCTVYVIQCMSLTHLLFWGSVSLCTKLRIIRLGASIVVQVKLPPTNYQLSKFRTPIWVPTTLFLIQFPADAAGKLTHGGPSAGVLAIHMGSLDGVLGSWIHQSPALATAAILGENSGWNICLSVSITLYYSKSQMNK